MEFLQYNAFYFDRCLELFDENCPKYFAENEKDDYTSFLKGCPLDYFVGVNRGCVISAFGIISTVTTLRTRISWIMVSTQFKGSGVGIKMMDYSKSASLEKGALAIDIAASHLSAPFFAKFGAKELNRTQNGWGTGMDKVNMEIKLQ